MQEVGSGHGINDAETETPAQKIARRLLNSLQTRLDKYEMEIESIREELNALVVQYPGESQHERTKTMLRKELRRLQRKVDRVIQEMEEAKAGDLHLLPAMRDELFAALPHHWKVRTKRYIAWAMIIVSAAMNLFALGYQLATL
eukprot:TRINITY_DN10071_c0_g1_i1.p2 TRINITY_DN10071_c0_g1~~TRINITY_DN10071_c0_g1_i1.p2  ORF type:complete len:144 (+),score=41.18 TRINITY_DN10071_c0_g1_i1:403-834(+)